MNNLIETCVTYDKMMENGELKRVTEAYMVDAMSFTEAEARITEAIAPFIKGDFKVSAVKRANIGELYDEGGGDRFYKAKLKLVTLDEKTGAEKESSYFVLVLANDFEEALQKLNKGLKGTMMDYRIHTVTETKILEVFPCNG